MPVGLILAGGLVSGLAVWCSSGVLERVPAGARIVRIGLLPSPWVALACALLATAALAAIVHLAARASGRGETRRTVADLCLPALATGVLILPYLPHLADWFPALTVLAGPFKWVVWAAAAVLLARAVAAVWTPPVRFGRRGLAASILAAGLALYGSVAARLVETSLFPAGDEPHYLVIAQSLWRDGDLAIENNHRRGDTLEYFSRPLTPHYLTRGRDAQIYSIHPVGLPVAAAPIYAMAGYRGVVAALVFVSALAGLAAWALARRLTSAASATVGWLACAAGAPFVFNSFTVYPEVPAALATITAFGLALRLDRAAAPTQARLALGCGLALATLPWLSSKYAAMAGAVGLVAIARIWSPRPDATTASRVRAVALLAVVPVLSLAAWLAFFMAIWGTFSPSAPYGSQRALSLGYLAAGGPGLLFDQEYGVLAFAPALALALAGFTWMLAAGGPARRIAIESAGVFAALLVPVGAFHQWWGGSAALGRPIVAALLLGTVPVAWLYERARDQPALRAAVWLLIAGGAVIVATLAFAQQGLLLVGDRDGSARLLDWWSPGWPLVAAAPSFVAQTPWRAAIAAAVWIGGLGAALVLLARVGASTRPGRAGLLAFAAAAAALSAIAVAVPLVPGRAALYARNLAERPQSPLLRDYDEKRRPIGVVYDPMTVKPPAAVAALVVLTAGPGEREARTPVPLLHRARWSLPAGQYRLELEGPPDGRLTGELGLQLGRLGGPVETWAIADGRRWATTLTLPINVGFVGLRASEALAAVRPVVRLTPLRLTSAAERLEDLEVLAARRIGSTTLFFHDDGSFPEQTGTWLKADATTRLSIATAPHTALRLRLRAGAAATDVEMRIDGRRQAVSLQPGQLHEVALAPGRGPRRVAFTTRGGFVPARVEPGRSTDTRPLAAWLEVSES